MVADVCEELEALPAWMTLGGASVALVSWLAACHIYCSRCRRFSQRAAAVQAAGDDDDEEDEEHENQIKAQFALDRARERLKASAPTKMGKKRARGAKRRGGERENLFS